MEQEFENDGAEEGRAGDGEDPGVHDAPGDAPADGGEAASSADADNGAGNGVGGADGNAEDGVSDNCQPTGSLRGEAAEGNELGDALAHGLDDAPSASHGAAAHSQVAADDDPVGDREGLEQATGNKSRGDNAHAFLRIICTVAEAEERRRKQLQAAEPAVDFLGTLEAHNPTGDEGQNDGENHAHDRREEDEGERLDPASEDERLEAGARDGGAAVAANESVGGTRWQAEDEGNQVPGNRAEQAGKQDLLVDKFDVNHALANGAGDSGAEDEGSDEVPEGSPGN